MRRSASEITFSPDLATLPGVAAPLLELRAVGKRYGSTRALDGVCFDLQPGEVHVLAGGNGAGKSTLIKILSGAIGDYSGELLVEGSRRRFRDPREAVSAGIATIHQELSLSPALSVLDNLFLGERRALGSWWTARRGSAEARRALAQVGLELDLEQRVAELGLAERQLVEIARGLRQAARVLILDEPTSALTEPEAERLFARVGELRKSGRGVVFISHRLDEIFRLADRITILRDGRAVHTGPRAELDERRLTELMVGEVTAIARSSSGGVTGDVVLSASGLTLRSSSADRPLLADLSLELHAGEILGVAGLQDAGASELCLALYGAVADRTKGEVRLCGERYHPRSPVEAVARGVTLLPRDRRDSVFPALSIAENVSLSSLGRVSRGGLVARGRERALAERVTASMRLVARSLRDAAGSLSGGNQQKVALGRCLATEPAVLLLDDPTRGVDVAAKADLHRLVRESAARGAAVLFVSSDFDELARLADRVLVLFRGRSSGVVPAAELDRARLLSLCMGAS
jgi:ABC-type sugar transport system ATPase subunit